LGGLLLADQVVFLKNGRKITGQVTKLANDYQIKSSSGGTVVVSADDVLKVEDVQSPKTEFQQRLEKIDPKDADKLYELARWANGQGQFANAKTALDMALKADPQHENARLLLKVVESKIGPGETPATKTSPAKNGDAAIKAEMLLSADDIARIRLQELREGDQAPIELKNKVLDRFIKANQGALFTEPGEEQAFRRKRAVDQALYILKYTDRDRDKELREDILVKGDPRVMREFRTRVWPILQANCATGSCHGAVTGAGNLRLFCTTTGEPDVIYTNFYILHARGMLNRGDPENSLLLQYGLPKPIAAYKHPKDVELTFRSRDDRQFKLIQEWITSLRAPLLGIEGPGHGYGVSYTVPGEKIAAPEPPGKPASAPAGVWQP
jgi:tetratricopeptide (TPR) repeat protein